MKFLSKTQANIISNPNIDLIIKTDRLRTFEAFVDTGFDGYICINEDLAKIIQLETSKKGTITINADGQKTFNQVAVIHISFGDFELPFTEYSVPAILKPNLDKDMIIGNKFVDKFCRDNQLIFCVDHIGGLIYFAGR